MRLRANTSKKKLTAHKKTLYTKQPLNHLHPTQSINPTKVEGPFSIDNLVSDQSKRRNKYFSFCIGKKSSLKTIIFLASHTVQNKQEGAAFQTFFLLFPTKAPFFLLLSNSENGKSSFRREDVTLFCHVHDGWL